MGATIAYCTVSSRDQNPQLQLDALDAHGYDRLFAETESGKRGVRRPEFAKAGRPAAWRHAGVLEV
ncbi:MAG: hypothetical protein ACRDOU_25580 [Streptosporangiaceae bacterium]